MLSKLFDFILLSRFKKWFFPVDEQSAYQPGRSCADNIFLIRCLINLSYKIDPFLKIAIVKASFNLSMYLPVSNELLKIMLNCSEIIDFIK